MPHHLLGQIGDVSRYVFCPGSQARARRIADQFENVVTVSEERGIVVYSGTYKGVFMTSCGTGMGGPATAIAIEELGQLGADTFIRVGSCGVLQEWLGPGSIILASGTYRDTGTGRGYLPLAFPAVPTFEVLHQLYESALALDVPVSVGVGIASDAFYGTRGGRPIEIARQAGALFIEMESDTLFLIGQVRRWRTAALFVSDGAPGQIKPESGRAAVEAGEGSMIRVALHAMLQTAHHDSMTSSAESN